jgi:putative transposase
MTMRVGRDHPWPFRTRRLRLRGIPAAARRPYHRIMAKAAHNPRPGASFVAIPTRDRLPLFEIARVAEMFVDTLLHYRTLGHYKLHAYVVMPDCVHLILTPQAISLDLAVELIKGGFTYRLDTDLPVWAEKYAAYSIANIRDLEIARSNLHDIPVRARLAATAELFPYSSAFRVASSAQSQLLALRSESTGSSAVH